MNKPRAASVVCKEDCEYLIMEKSDYKNILMLIEKQKFEKKLSFFNKFFFKNKYDRNI